MSEKSNVFNKLTLILSGASIAVCFGGMVLAHKEIVAPSVGAGLFVASGLLGLAALVAASLVVFIHRAYPVALVGAFGLMPLIAVLTGLLGAYQHPRINDISTDLSDPPAFVAAAQQPGNAGRDLSFPPGNAEQIKLGYSRIQPLNLNLSPQQGYERALEVAQMHKDWEITRQDAATLTFEGVAKSKLFRWHDDFIVRVRPGADGGSRVDIRSKSRELKSDLGANARRIEQYFAELQQYDVRKAQ